MRKARRRDADTSEAPLDTESPPPSDGSGPLGLPAAAPDAVPWPATHGNGWDWRTSELVSASQQSYRRGSGSGRSYGVGIDLGSTNSVVAVIQAGIPVVIPNGEGACSTPSEVAFTKGGGVLVGDVARRQAITNPDRTIASVKRHMGTN